jgi:hypothetical protein
MVAAGGRRISVTYNSYFSRRSRDINISVTIVVTVNACLSAYPIARTGWIGGTKRRFGGGVVRILWRNDIRNVTRITASNAVFLTLATYTSVNHAETLAAKICARASFMARAQRQSKHLCAAAAQQRQGRGAARQTIGDAHLAASCFQRRLPYAGVSTISPPAHRARVYIVSLAAARAALLACMLKV